MSDTPRTDRLSTRLVELRTRLRKVNPEALAERSGTRYRQLNGQSGVFLLEFWEQPIRINYPEFEAYTEGLGSPLTPYLQAMLLYYLVTCDGTPPAGKWIAFSDLPDGRFYNHAFQGYTGRKLAAVFKDDLVAFQRASEKNQGKRVYAIGDVAYVFQALPLVPLLVVAWLGDEEMPSTYQILFDAHVSHHLVTDACAVIGSMLTERLIQSSQDLVN